LPIIRLAVVIGRLFSFPCGQAKKSPPPKPADLSAVDNKETAIAIPGVSALMELGFHWHICARAIEAAEGDFDRAAESLFTLEDASVPLRELEVGLFPYSARLEEGLFV
jgi:hypothetical protein